MRLVQFARSPVSGYGCALDAARLSVRATRLGDQISRSFPLEFEMLPRLNWLLCRTTPHTELMEPVGWRLR